MVGGDRLAYRVPVLIIRADKGTVIESVPYLKIAISVLAEGREGRKEGRAALRKQN